MPVYVLCEKVMLFNAIIITAKRPVQDKKGDTKRIIIKKWTFLLQLQYFGLNWPTSVFLLEQLSPHLIFHSKFFNKGFGLKMDLSLLQLLTIAERAAFLLAAESVTPNTNVVFINVA